MKRTSETSTTLQLTAVGEVRSIIKTPMLQAGQSDIELQERLEKVRKQHRQVKETVSELVIFDPWAELLDGIEAFSHIVVLYWPHLIDSERRNLRKVHPMGRKDLPIQGIFATRSPARPNPILVSTVPLMAREGNILKVKGLEAVDRSPLIDIKPFVQSYDIVENARFPEWMQQIHRDLEAL
ncbi:MAG: tRNA (N6-threonylcarbamoyladenosine(37)-N6)-methyltransferase TrmO [Desulfosarcinaceae bacterium]